MNICIMNIYMRQIYVYINIYVYTHVFVYIFQWSCVDVRVGL